MSNSLRIGITLPAFAHTGEPAFAVAEAAEAGGLDGVFALNHLWPIGSRGRPALWMWPVLGAVAARTTRVSVGTLVARVGLLSEDDLINAFAALRAIAGPDRVVAVVGAGDRLSAAENWAFGVPYPVAKVRLADVAHAVELLRGRGFEPWIGGMSEAVADLAAGLAAARNLWGATVEEVRVASTQNGNVPLITWSGQVLVGRTDAEVDTLRQRYGDRQGLVAGTVEEVATHLGALHAAGAAWCVCAPLDGRDEPRRSAETICLVAEAVP